jgi:hypothetical protein
MRLCIPTESDEGLTAELAVAADAAPLEAVPCRKRVRGL